MVFLGHVVTTQGIKVDQAKVEAESNLITPSDAGDVRSFLEVAGYYRRFIEGFSKMASPMTELMRKGVEFKRTK